MRPDKKLPNICNICKFIVIRILNFRINGHSIPILNNLAYRYCFYGSATKYPFYLFKARI